ncbi:hypothetical protein Lupro_08095 [Lutibacter profundi]|uniref:DUF4270 domain-containing protein n=1 Tax=Lutibacter profundi TaxID=1622118 RepID=A0A109RPW6_9FLAO|nr:DUF4270 domain-containing protein [Lutibacter profundi]AMC11217.1 hypothetical protein Lupro_08095 [Lutibacter profundi]
MTTKVVNAIKYFGLLFLVFFMVISCEQNIESIGVNLVDNNNFSTNALTSEVFTTPQNINRVPTTGIPQYLLGVYSDPEFGKLKASIVSQLSLPVIDIEYNYGTNSSIDSVILNIPYQVTREENYADGKPKFSIDSIIGDTDVEFQLSVYELKTFLNTLDPEDPSKNAVYYSDKVFQKGTTPFYSANFKVNPDDTISIIKRYLADGTVFDKDTIKQTDLSPSIKIPLNESMIQQIFVDNASGIEFSSLDEFHHYFRGLYIEAEELLNDKSHLISLNMANAKITIYFSNDEDEGADIDLNGNGVNGEQGVRIKKEFIFVFGAIKSNILERDYTNSRQSGNDRLYVQGAAGTMEILELFKNENINELQSNNWLITDANLTFYVDQNASSNIAPEQLLLYNYDKKEHIRDMMSEGLAAFGGRLERDEDGNPYKYVFKITDYVSELLKSEEPLDLVKLGLRVYNSTDLPASIIDNKIKDFNWNPKGVVLFGANESAGDKKVKLEISYSQINN